MTLPPRLSLVTIGARDIGPLRDFYVRLGWPVVFQNDEFVCFGTRGGVVALFAMEALAADAHLPADAAPRGIRNALATNVDERHQVDEAIEAVRAAGGRITKEPEDAPFGGRSAYWLDPEDNAWEVAWVPADSTVAKAIRAAGGYG